MSESAGRSYLARHIDRALDQLLPELPALMLTGPRGCGKTTTASRRACSTLRLDRPEQAAALTAAPDEILSALAPPVLLDEWQLVPESLGAIKRAVDAGTGPGRFLITGSVRAGITATGWPATGRVVPLAMCGLTRAEIEETASGQQAIERLFGAEEPRSDSPPCELGLLDYVDMALDGGFPDAIGLSAFARLAWYDGYVDQLIRRDIAELEPAARGLDAMSRLLHAVALNSAGSPTITSLGRAAEIDQRTTARYLELLEDVGVIERLPAWNSSRLKRLVRLPKYYLTDTGMAAYLSGDNRDGVLTSGDRLGRIVDTFVAAQLRPLLALSFPRTRGFHLRDANGDREVDLVLESADGSVVGIEVKAAAAVTPRDARHLAWLRDQLGSSFVRGVVLHTGPHTFPLGERLWAMPIGALWRS